MNPTAAISFPLNNPSRLDEEIDRLSRKELSSRQEVVRFTDLSKLAESKAKIWAVAIIVTAIVLIAIGIGTAFIHPFCALIATVGLVLLGALFLPARKIKEGQHYDHLVNRLNSEIPQLEQTVSDLKTLKIAFSPSLKNYAKTRGIESLSYNEYLKIPEPIKIFCKAYPDYIPKPTPDLIPPEFQRDPILSQYICPITQKPIYNPVTEPSDHGAANPPILYERQAAFEWFKEHGKLPLSSYNHLIEQPSVLRKIIARLNFLYSESPSVKKLQEDPCIPPEGARAWSDEELLEVKCPITMDIPRCPVEDLSIGGKALYEKAAIDKWFATKRISPLTLQTISADLLRERPDLADRIAKLLPVAEEPMAVQNDLAVIDVNEEEEPFQDEQFVIFVNHASDFLESQEQRGSLLPFVFRTVLSVITGERSLFTE